MPLKNYGTSVSPERSTQQIMSLLAVKGAREILLEYDGIGQIAGLSWRVDTPHGNLPFRLPVNVEAVQRTLAQQNRDREGVTKNQTTITHARKVAWRTIKDWVDAQMALLETEQVALDQIFLPYMVVKEDQNLYDHMIESGFQIALPPGLEFRFAEVVVCGRRFVVQAGFVVSFRVSAEDTGLRVGHRPHQQLLRYLIRR